MLVVASCWGTPWAHHLNPDLVFDVNQILLCCVCAKNPMTKDQESIAAGNNYG